MKGNQLSNLVNKKLNSQAVKWIFVFMHCTLLCLALPAVCWYSLGLNIS